MHGLDQVLSVVADTTACFDINTSMGRASGDVMPYDKAKGSAVCRWVQPGSAVSCFMQHGCTGRSALSNTWCTPDFKAPEDW